MSITKLNKTQLKLLLDELEKMFPNARCELDYENHYQLLIAVILSAQTTDKRVNEVTKRLFDKYPNSQSLAIAFEEDVLEIIKSLGLANTKAKNIINAAKVLKSEYNGVVPLIREHLMTLPGVGRKTANVMLSEGAKVPAIAVDTHVQRVSNRLGLANSAVPLEVERSLMALFDSEDWYRVHHLLLFFGRYFCKAINPNCCKCPFIKQCTKIAKNPL